MGEGINPLLSVLSNPSWLVTCSPYFHDLNFFPIVQIYSFSFITCSGNDVLSVSFEVDVCHFVDVVISLVSWRTLLSVQLSSIFYFFFSAPKLRSSYLSFIIVSSPWDIHPEEILTAGKSKVRKNENFFSLL